MSESKSDALTNLATPLHGTAARAAPLELVQPAQCTSGCSGRPRHIRPSQPGAGNCAGSVASGRSAVPALANTALPEPVMRPLPKRDPSLIIYDFDKRADGSRFVRTIEVNHESE